MFFACNEYNQVRVVLLWCVLSGVGRPCGLFTYKKEWKEKDDDEDRVHCAFSFLSSFFFVCGCPKTARQLTERRK